jgi:hypothetical protein
VNATVAKLVDAMKAVQTTPIAAVRREAMNARELKNLAVAWNSSPLRDPFKKRGVFSDKSAREQLALTGILRQTGSELAVINNRILAIGDSILDFKIESVEADHVWVSGPNGKEMLEFKVSVPQPKAPEALASDPITQSPPQTRPSSRNRDKKTNAAGEGAPPTEVPVEEKSSHIVDSIALVTMEYGSLLTISPLEQIESDLWSPISNIATIEANDLIYSRNFVKVDDDNAALMLHY